MSHRVAGGSFSIVWRGGKSKRKTSDVPLICKRRISDEWISNSGDLRGDYDLRHADIY